MNIIVLVKQVPDTSEVKINRETNTLIRDGVPSIINPFDMYAIEEALRLRETARRQGDGRDHGTAAGRRSAQRSRGHGRR